MQIPIRLPPVRIIRPAAAKVNDDHVQAQTFNFLDNNGKEAEFLRRKNVTCEFWNSMLSFLPYLNRFIDCYSFFLVCYCYLLYYIDVRFIGKEYFFSSSFTI